MSARRLRSLEDSDLPPHSISTARLGDMLVLLIAHGDDEWVSELTRMVQYRVAWLLSRDTDDGKG